MKRIMFIVMLVCSFGVSFVCAQDMFTIPKDVKGNVAVDNSFIGVSYVVDDSTNNIQVDASGGTLLIYGIWGRATDAVAKTFTVTTSTYTGGNTVANTVYSMVVPASSSKEILFLDTPIKVVNPYFVFSGTDGVCGVIYRIK